MNNIVIEKMTDAEDTVYLSFLVETDNIRVKQDFFDICTADLIKAEDMLLDYFNNNREVYIVFSDAFNNTTENDFSLKIQPKNSKGNLKIEVSVRVDIDYNNLEECIHKCCFFINTDIGALEQFGKKIRNLIYGDIGTKISLY